MSIKRYYHGTEDDVAFSTLMGLTIERYRVEPEADGIWFQTTCGKVFLMFHQQDCCEHVSIDEIHGDMDDLVGVPILTADEVSISKGEGIVPQRKDVDKDQFGESTYEDDSYTWTFYSLRTIRGSVTIRWYGSSNGYYSERVELVKFRDTVATIEDAMRDTVDLDD
jgi:hypothetical protein